MQDYPHQYFKYKGATGVDLGLAAMSTSDALTTATPREIKKIVRAIETLEGDGVLVRRSIGTPEMQSFSPFLMLDHGEVADGHGFPDHPHRGQETISYILNGKLEHEDFVGNRGILKSGDLQFMTAGKGIMHSEMPLPGDDGSPNSGLQLWVDLPEALKMCEPRYRDLLAKEIPKATADGGKVVVKIISGASYGVQSVKNLTYTPVWYLDFTVQPGGKVQQAIPRGWNALIYILSGKLSIGTISAKKYDLAVFDINGDSFKATVTEDCSEPARFIFIAGLPLEQNIVQYGPFVMTNKQDVIQATIDFRTYSNGFERARNWESRAEKRRKSLS